MICPRLHSRAGQTPLPGAGGRVGGPRPPPAFSLLLLGPVLLGPKSSVPMATTVNPRDPQTSIFHLTVPPGPPGSEAPLSPAQLHRGHSGPQPPTQNQGCPGPWPPRGSAVAPGAAWQGARPCPGCFSRGPLALCMLSPVGSPQQGCLTIAEVPASSGRSGNHC